jgi:hypothetical protein
MNNGNSNMACTYRYNCDCHYRLKAYQIRSVDSPYYHPYRAHTYWIS